MILPVDDPQVVGLVDVAEIDGRGRMVTVAFAEEKQLVAATVPVTV